MVTKIFVNSELQATIPCPECGNSYHKDVSKFIRHHKEVKLRYTCRCKHQFSVLLERRRFIRKDKEMNGHVIEGEKRIPLKVLDISKYGIKIKLFARHQPVEDDILTIDFVLDDPGRSRVTTKVRIRRIISNGALGCEFLDPDHYDNLGKYFLFHF